MPNMPLTRPFQTLALLSTLCSTHSALASQATPAAAALNPSARETLQAAVVRNYADDCWRAYRACERSAAELGTAVDALLQAPSAASLAKARQAWIAARKDYVPTEAQRFYDGPIDKIEGYINAWPIDEAYLDYVDGAPRSGIVNDRTMFPQIAETVLMFANERGGEANVTVGWHAIEFLLWGQDLRSDGPGDRPFTDFDASTNEHAERRGEYLRITVRLLRRHLSLLTAAWRPDADNYRREFEADPSAAVRKILVGITILTAFEMAGERLAVAYETQDQEQEHSCFSDTTWEDFEGNQLGVQRVVVGDRAAGTRGILPLVASADVGLARLLEQRVATTLECLRKIPRPFDVAMRGGDDAPGRVAIRAALLALEAQTEVLTLVGGALGHDLPLQPAGVR